MHYRFDQFIKPVLVDNVLIQYVLLSQKQWLMKLSPLD
jgi:hypothetical protein